MLTDAIAKLRGDRQLFLGTIVGTALMVLMLVRAYDGAGSFQSFLQVT